MLHPYRFIGAADPLNKIVGYPNLSRYMCISCILFSFTKEDNEKDLVCVVSVDPVYGESANITRAINVECTYNYLI